MIHNNEEITNTIVSNSSNINNYICSYNVSNIIIIPIKIVSEIIGILCLGNKETKIEDNEEEKYIDLIDLLQFIVDGNKFIDDYKKIYSDSTYFSKDLFLANVSHEIRTPLNGIIGYNQLLMQTDVNDVQKEYLSSMNECSIQLLQIINDIIDFSKLTSGNMKIILECCSIKKIIKDVYNTMRHKIKSKKQNFSYEINKNVPEFIIIDRQKLLQILINLISNASNFTGISGNIFVNISNDNYTLNIYIEDNGIGIAEKEQYKLFNSFTQVENSIIKAGGTGLGLAITKRLVELLKGTINVKSILGKGSTFYFSCEHNEPDIFSDSLQNNLKTIKDKQVLIIDDNVDNRIIISEMIHEWKMFPTTCGTAKEAYKYIINDRYDFDIVLLDICMPDMNGIDLAKKIKSKKPFIPLIALSSLNSFVNTSNFEEVLEKPVNKLQLLNSIYLAISNNSHNNAFIGDSIVENETDDKYKDNFVEYKNINILIVEDILHNQHVLKNMITSIGYNNIDIANDGSEAIEFIDKIQYNIILLDLRMPYLDGYDVINYIKKKDKIKLSTVIIVTASVLEEDRYKCKKLGIQWFLNKPLKIPDLKKTILKCLK
jgi:signal transduction histidine kinase/DNA-binding response OmpR family regulator